MSELIKDIALPLIGIVVGAISTLLTLHYTTKNSIRSVASVAEQELRKDLINLYSKQQQRIELLEADITTVREKNMQLQEKNAEMYELYLKEREKVAHLEHENVRLKERVDMLVTERAKLADQVIVMEDQVRRLQQQVKTIEDHTND